jgi:hypothetical protein
LVYRRWAGPATVVLPHVQQVHRGQWSSELFAVTQLSQTVDGHLGGPSPGEPVRFQQTHSAAAMDEVPRVR